MAEVAERQKRKMEEKLREAHEKLAEHVCGVVPGQKQTRARSPKSA